MDNKFDNMNDEEICACIQKGDKDGIDYLLNKYKDFVKKKARAYFLMGGESDDVIQEGMIGLMKAIWDYKPELRASFSTFASLCIDRQIYSAVKASRRKKHQPLNSYVSLYEPTENEENAPVLLDTLDEGSESPEEYFFGKEDRQQMWDALCESLSSLEKKVLCLFMEGLSCRQIAEELGKGEKAIDNAISRIKKKARQIEIL